jgi:transposase
MEEVGIIGLDLAKNVFQAHGAAADGSVVFRRKLARGQVLKFFASQPRCTVAMEACASAHHWARTIGALGHEVRLIAPGYVKPFVKRQKSDTADAEAIVEAASRPTMRFVAPKTEAQQAAAMAFRTRDLLVRQRTQTINALRGHLAEYGVVAPAGPAHIGRLIAVIDGENGVLPGPVAKLARLLVAQIMALSEQIGMLEKELRARAASDEVAVRLMTAERAALSEAQAEIERLRLIVKSSNAASLDGVPSGSMPTSCSSGLKTWNPILRGPKPNFHQWRPRPPGPGRKSIDQACRHTCPARIRGSISSTRPAHAAAVRCMRSVRRSARCSTMCPRDSGLSASAGRAICPLSASSGNAEKQCTEAGQALRHYHQFRRLEPRQKRSILQGCQWEPELQLP